ncbi:hypothetical protein [Legionella brunensis]|uniref:Histone-lysine N-methyltransferase, H3 lysine-79 specific n=1 Tax=Legionella brunensis TaxID=29422 RepID=A0A0W0S0R3_9GAMM|nr:hypothetical protein [Legionella brunensis]KTC76994.1 putative methyltransferase [Legionella brunensis]
MLSFLLSLLLFAATLIGLRVHRHWAIKNWRRALSLDKHSAIFQKLYGHIDGFTLSRIARMKSDAMKYIYGEIDFESFIALLSLCNPNAATIFYDLGSGTGKAVIACALVFDIQKSCGIEILPALHQCAQMQQKQLRQSAGYQEKAERITFILGDLLETDFRNASIVFINATAFFGEYWFAISRHMEQLKPGAIVISTSKALLSNRFIISKTTAVTMSWGIVNAYIQERQPDNAVH